MSEAVSKIKCESCDGYFDPEDGITMYECPECNEVFAKEDVGNHRCPECGSFSSKVSDKCCPDCRDGAKCEPVEAFQCEECDEWFDSQGELDDHYEEEYPEEEEDTGDEDEGIDDDEEGEDETEPVAD